MKWHANWKDVECPTGAKHPPAKINNVAEEVILILHWYEISFSNIEIFVEDDKTSRSISNIKSKEMQKIKQTESDKEKYLLLNGLFTLDKNNCLKMHNPRNSRPKNS